MSNNQLQTKETIDLVTTRVKDFQAKGDLILPANYSAENALKSAWLILQETQDKDYKPVLESCSKVSIANALLSMVVQGLNPDKKQCYFIAYGKKLTMQRSYFGSMAIAKSVNPDIEEIYADVVYKNDIFEYEKIKGKTIVTSHKQKLENISKDSIIAAYCTILYKSGKEESTIMTLDQIKQAWKQSKMNPVDANGNIKAGSTHDKFTAEMCLKTVINKACKPIINSSDDSNLMVKFAKQCENDMRDAEVEEEISNNANREFIDIDITGTEDSVSHSEYTDVSYEDVTGSDSAAPSDDERPAFE